MKKIAVALMTVSAVVLGFGAAANASPSGYPPEKVTVTVSSSNPAAGSTITATITGCVEGENADFVLGSSTASGVTSGGSASGTLTVPTAAGTYTGTASCASGASASFSITVSAPSGGLPATGSSGISSRISRSRKRCRNRLRLSCRLPSRR